MSKTEKESVLSVTRRRYAMMRTKKARGRILDEFCSTTGFSRKHAIKALSPGKRPAGRRGCPPGGTGEAIALLVRLWKLSDMMCGKLLKAVIAPYMDSMRKREEIPEWTCAEVLGMSASTIDRRLRTVKAKTGGGKRRRRESLDMHRREIPLKVETWPESYPKEPGWIEADTVAHCGGSMAGSFAWTLTLTDVATAWTALKTIWNKGAEGVRDAAAEFINETPFDVLAFNSDNGPEFLNSPLKAFFGPLAGSIIRTRSRSYRKNDNAHVEQKNGVQVRALFGYGRIDDPDLLPLMGRIDRTQGLIKNLFTPTMRLLSKERVGSKYCKRYEKTPKTPAQRVLESAAVSENNKDKVREMLAKHDICELREKLNADLRLLAKALNNPSGASGDTLQRQKDHQQKPPARIKNLSVSSHLTQPVRLRKKVC
jgi:hypothetical protein